MIMYIPMQVDLVCKLYSVQISDTVADNARHDFTLRPAVVDYSACCGCPAKHRFGGKATQESGSMIIHTAEKDEAMGFDVATMLTRDVLHPHDDAPSGASWTEHPLPSRLPYEIDPLLPTQNGRNGCNGRKDPQESRPPSVPLKGLSVH